MSINVTDNMIIEFSTKDQESLEIALLIHKNYRDIVKRSVEEFINNIKSRISVDPRFSKELTFDCDPSAFFTNFWSGGFLVHDVWIMFERQNDNNCCIGCCAQESVAEDLKGLYSEMNNAYKKGNCQNHFYWKINFDGFMNWLDIDLLTRFLNGDKNTIDSFLDTFGDIVKIAVPFIEHMRSVNQRSSNPPQGS